MTSRLTVEPQANGVLAIAGELSLAEAPTLEHQLQEVLDAATADVVLDLGGIEFIDSTGLGVLVRAHQRASERGISFRVCNARTQARRLLSLTGLEGLLTGEESGTPDSRT